MSPATDAVIEFPPSPSVQATDAIPNEFVSALVEEIEPEPLRIANVTLTFATASPSASVTLTVGGIGTGLPAGAFWPSPAATPIVVGGAGTAVALNVNGLPASVPDDAVIEFGPSDPPRTQLPTVAIPLSLVTALPPVTDPPPDT